MSEREARADVIVGGGFAGGYVARILGKRGATIVSPENSMLFTRAAARGRLGNARAAPRGRAAARDVPALRAAARPRDRARLRRQPRRGRHARGARRPSATASSSSRSARSRARCRSPAWPTTRSASRTSPTRSTCATTSCSGSTRPTRRPPTTDRERELTFVFVGAGYAGVEALAELSDLVRDALRYYPSLRHAPQRWVLVDAAPKILPEIPTRLGEYAAEQLTKRGVEIRVGTTLESVDQRRRAALERRALLDATRSSGRPA